MLHLTLNTEDRARAPTVNLAPASTSLIAHLVPRGGKLPGPLSAFRVDMGMADGAASFCIWRGRAPIVLSVCCWQEDASEGAWTGVERQYFKLAEQGALPGIDRGFLELPTECPWLASLLLPGLLVTARDDCSWLASFEQSFAQAIINHAQGA